MKFPMIQANKTGGLREIPDQEASLGPPPNPTGLKTEFGAVESMFAFSRPAGTHVPAHNAPQPYICIVLSGQAEISTSDGDKRTFGPDDVLFCDDLTGKGHGTSAITDFVAAFKTGLASSEEKEAKRR